MAPKKKETYSTRSREITIRVHGSARVHLEDIVGDRTVDSIEAFEELWEEAEKKAKGALEGCELHGIELDNIPLVFNLYID